MGVRKARFAEEESFTRDERAVDSCLDEDPRGSSVAVSHLNSRLFRKSESRPWRSYHRQMSPRRRKLSCEIENAKRPDRSSVPHFHFPPSLAPSSLNTLSLHPIRPRFTPPPSLLRFCHCAVLSVLPLPSLDSGLLFSFRISSAHKHA